MAINSIYRSKTLIEIPVAILAVNCRDEDHVALITLHVFQVLNEKRFKRGFPFL